MSEGELKRRIGLWFDRIEDRCDTPHIQETREYLETNLAEMLDDARKEFAKWQGREPKRADQVAYEKWWHDGLAIMRKWLGSQ